MVYFFLWFSQFLLFIFGGSSVRLGQRQLGFWYSQAAVPGLELSTDEWGLDGGRQPQSFQLLLSWNLASPTWDLRR